MNRGPLHRSRRHRVFGGVCGGLRRLARLGARRSCGSLYVVVSICSAAFPGTIVYLVLWLVMPLED